MENNIQTEPLRAFCQHCGKDYYQDEITKDNFVSPKSQCCGHDLKYILPAY
jgi:hypothetical protein